MQEMVEYHKKDWGADFEENREKIMESTQADFKFFDKDSN